MNLSARDKQILLNKPKVIYLVKKGNWFKGIFVELTDAKTKLLGSILEEVQ